MTTTPEVETVKGALTPKTIKRMRAADRIHFRHAIGAGLITLVEEEPYPIPDRDTLEMLVDSRVDSYRKHAPGEPMGDPSWECRCHACVYNFTHTPSEWGSLAAFVRAGDVLSLRWIEDNNNEHTRDAGLHVDELTAIVSRKARRYAFRLTSSVNPGDTARMIQR